MFFEYSGLLLGGFSVRYDFFEELEKKNIINQVSAIKSYCHDIFFVRFS